MRSLTVKARCGGMSLVEMMIAIVMGLIVVGGLTSLVVASIRTNNDNMNMTRLTQELRGAMQVVTRDLRRAGFSRNALLDVGTGAMTNPFIDVSYVDDPTVADNSGILVGVDDDDCLLYSYDGKPGLSSGAMTVDDINGALEADGSEQHGVRYNANDLVIEYKAGSASTCDQSSDWEPMTDKNAVEITALTFGDVGGTGNLPTVTSSTGSITVREIQVTISGRLKDDPSVTRTIQDTVRVRNDQFVPSP